MRNCFGMGVKVQRCEKHAGNRIAGPPTSVAPDFRFSLNHKWGT
jgi:hypothetical protein